MKIRPTLILIIARYVMSLNVIAQENNQNPLTLAENSTTQTSSQLASPQQMDDRTTDIWHWKALSGNWFGTRTTLEESGVSFAGAYKSDVFSVAHGGQSHGSDYLFTLDLATSVDLEKLLDWKGATLSVDVMKMGGGIPGLRAGVAQGISNLEAYDNLCIYSATIEQKMFENRLSLMAGLYDFCSDFYALQSTGAFINPAFGLGWDMAQSGQQGPSVYPVTSLGLRIKWEPLEYLYVQTAVLDGVPGDPSQSSGTHILLRKDDGLFIASEAGYNYQTSDGLSTKLAVGVWAYTASFDDLVETNDLTLPLRRSDNKGIYLLAEYAEHYQTFDITVFGRMGFANHHLNRFDYTYTGGLTINRLITNDDILGIAISVAHNGSDYQTLNSLQGFTLGSSETVAELTYSFVFTPWLTIQPDVQIFINPDTNVDRGDVFATGVRFTLNF